ncbi:MAG: hypothetical protein WD069_00645 [Planctomycetales bacterium]
MATIEILIVGTVLGLGLIAGVAVLKQAFQTRTRAVARGISRPHDPLAAATPRGLSQFGLLSSSGGPADVSGDRE